MKNFRNQDWKEQLRDSILSHSQLVEEGFLLESSTEIERVISHYSLKIPKYYAALVDWTSPFTCPIGIQVLPNPEELHSFQEESTDPIGDLIHHPVSRVTHRYKDRVLLHTSETCQVNCRFCFRKNLLNHYRTELHEGDYSAALSYIRSHTEICEVILTGGDPLLLSNEKLSFLLGELSKISHLKGIRIHTRMPVCLPDRIDGELISIFQSTLLPLTILTHFNHSKELTPRALFRLKMLKSAGVLLLNQSVLLKGVNDSEESLLELFSALYYAQVIPVYLHHPDQARGTRHFQLSLEKGITLHRSLYGKLPGGAIPRYVLDTPGGGGKVPLERPFFGPASHESGAWRVSSLFKGEVSYNESHENQGVEKEDLRN